MREAVLAKDASQTARQSLLEEMVRRRASGEPLAYVLGTCPQFDMSWYFFLTAYMPRCRKSAVWLLVNRMPTAHTHPQARDGGLDHATR